MDELLAARSQMALSLGFHIIFAAIGIAMPFFMAASHFVYLRQRDETYLLLTKAWSRGVAIFFAVGAVSGTALSFELGLLWPRFMEHAGPIIGMPFSLEGTAFFLEAIFIGIFLYGWDRVPQWMHWTSGLLVGVSGVVSGLFVICANGWMNSPSGFDWNGGHPINIDPVAAMFNDAALVQGVHMTVAAFQAVGFGVAGLHALLYLRTRLSLHAAALRISLVFGAVASLVQPLVGDWAAKHVAEHQPAKLAAMEALFETTERAPLLIGGLPDVEARRVRYAVELPGMLSFLAHGDFAAEVKGLDQVPRENWPPVVVVHVAFQMMVAVGGALALVGLAGLVAVFLRRAWLERPWLLWLLFACTPLGFVAIEAGWTVTEVGRQPWIIYGIMKTEEALTPRPGVPYTLVFYTLIYGLLSLVVTVLMVRQVKRLHAQLRGEPEQ